MMEFWNSLGEAGHLAIYAGGLSILAVLTGRMAQMSGVLGTIGKALKAIVDFFSANQKH